MVKSARPLSSMITLTIGGGLLALGLVLGLALAWGVGSLLHGAFQDQAQALARQLATVSLDPVLISDYGTLERYTQDLGAQPGVRYLRVRRADGEVLAEAGGPPDPQGSADLVWAQWPLGLGANQLGEVLVGHDATPVRHAVRRIALWWTAGLLLAVGALYFWLRRTLERQIVAPMQTLADRLGRPEDERDIPWGRMPQELTRVAHSFGDLCRRLEAAGRERTEAERLVRGATERLCREQRLASVGQMAAGLAHGLNTPLGNIVGYAQQARRGTQDPALRERLDVIEEQAGVCAGLVRHLLDSVRPPEAHPRPLDLTARVTAAVALMGPVLRDRGIERIGVSGTVATPVWADPSCVEQVLFNLMTNAGDAGAHGLDIELAQSGEQVWLTLADDGSGIPDGVRQRLFEPFVSGKPPGKGTGLGLHLCQTLLHSVGAQIALLETGPSGTRFRLTWRAVTSEAVA